MDSQAPGSAFPSPLGIDEREQDGIVVLTLSGELDLSAALDLETRIDDLLRRGVQRVLVDLRGLGFIDSTGVRALLEAHREAERRGADLALVPPDDGPVRRMFAVAGILDVLPFTDAPA